MCDSRLGHRANDRARASRRAPPTRYPSTPTSAPTTRPSPLKVPATQRYFDQGLRLVYGFNHAEAIRAFQRAAELDPTCAMCYWGIALAYGPHVNAPMDSASGVAAYAAVQRARSLMSHATPQERAYIEAVAQRYAADPPADRTQLDTLYSRAMGNRREHLPGRSRRRDAVRRIADGPSPVELLAAGRHAVPRHGRDRAPAPESHRPQPEPPRRVPLLHPRRRSGEPAGRGAVRRATRAAHAGRRTHGPHARAHLHPRRTLERRREGQPARHPHRRGVHRRAAARRASIRSRTTRTTFTSSPSPPPWPVAAPWRSRRRARSRPR